jgi:molecular chaperone DnaK
MVRDAEAHSTEDAALRAQVDARNELDTIAYEISRTLEENAGTMPEHERALAQLLVNDARTALEEQADIDRLRALTGEMYQVLTSLAERSAVSPSSAPMAE